MLIRRKLLTAVAALTVAAPVAAVASPAQAIGPAVLPVSVANNTGRAEAVHLYVIGIQLSSGRLGYVDQAGTFIAWSTLAGGIPQVVVADDLTRRWRTQTELPAFLGSSWDPSIVADGQRVMAGYGSGDEYPSDAFDITRRTTASAPWATVPTGGGVAPSIDSRGVVGLAAQAGGVTAVVFSGDTLYALPTLPWTN